MKQLFYKKNKKRLYKLVFKGIVLNLMLVYMSVYSVLWTLDYPGKTGS